ncbi:hypothetical protein [Streptomyces sp. NPDC059575]|uniref:hypothetical protein n=1 Tax=Streptomyces sp. NPDC059575 TaxID=3346872 RepID=UPI0036B800BD
MELLDALAELAWSGNLGPVENGAAWNEVTAALGEPWEVVGGRRRRSWPRLFAYGDLELSVCRCQKGNQCAVQATSSGVAFVFEIPDGEGPSLNVVGPPPHQHECPPLSRPS